MDSIIFSNGAAKISRVAFKEECFAAIGEGLVTENDRFIVIGLSYHLRDLPDYDEVILQTIASDIKDAVARAAVMTIVAKHKCGLAPST